MNVTYDIVTYFDLYRFPKPKQTTKPNTPPVVMLQPLTKGAIVHQTEPKNSKTRNGKNLSSQQTLETHDTSLVSRKKQKTKRQRYVDVHLIRIGRSKQKYYANRAPPANSSLVRFPRETRELYRVIYGVFVAERAPYYR